MKFTEPHVIKRAVFMVVILFPTLVILEFTGNSSTGLTAILAGIIAAISVVIFPDPEHLKKLEEAKKNEKTGDSK